MFDHKAQWPSMLRIHCDRKGHAKPSGKIRIWCCFDKIEFPFGKNIQNPRNIHVWLAAKWIRVYLFK